MSSEAAAPVAFSRLLSDERLTRRAVGGDERAFAAIFRRYHQPLYRFCLAIVGNPEDAQDALQNAMMKVLRALPGEERKIDLKPWLYRIAHNESIDLLRRRRETRPLDVEQAAPGYGLAEDVATRERLRRLIADMRELPDRQREVLVMRELAGLGFEEIGSALDTSGAVVRQTLYEARLSLRQMEEGREMNCDAVTKALSDGDGRVTRRRDVRAHLRSCAGCRQFREEINGRRQDLAALSPLPAIAATGMLQGMIGGSGAATGGGLAAALGGGAAKTIATSAAAKGVATVAVVAAVGVTAAERTGVIHLGLPGEGDAKSTKAVPAPAGVQPHTPAPGISPLHPAADGKGGAANGDVGGADRQAAPSGLGEGQAHAKGHAQANLHAPVTPGEHAAGRDHEKQHPSAAADGQEKAAENKPEAPEASGEAAAPDKPSKPATPAPPSAPPKEAPENPPAAAPEPPQQAPQPKSEAAREVKAPESAGEAGQGKGSEKKP
ncbi:MAG TPA: sigma-70 family RNA polymerase sigma factor [Solirubrobacterales bacterium]|nr:sigma-70 family RNA polymerase sigma factor [Solirubrobacterales bacterium]